MSLFTVRRQTDRTTSVRRIEIAMSTALPNGGVPTTDELHASVEREIDAYLERGSIDDGCGHVLDRWLQTCEADAQVALQESIDQQRQVDDVLVDKARTTVDRAERRFRRRRDRADRYAEAAQDCRYRALGTAAPVVVVPSKAVFEAPA